MKREILRILVCPECKGSLKLDAKEENEKGIVSGSLYCAQCHLSYQIKDYIPNLLPPEKVKRKK